MVRCVNCTHVWWMWHLLFTEGVPTDNTCWRCGHHGLVGCHVIGPTGGSMPNFWFHQWCWCIVVVSCLSLVCNHCVFKLLLTGASRYCTMHTIGHIVHSYVYIHCTFICVPFIANLSLCWSAQEWGRGIEYVYAWSKCFKVLTLAPRNLWLSWLVIITDGRKWSVKSAVYFLVGSPYLG